jgi:hypothetical protein
MCTSKVHHRRRTHQGKHPDSKRHLWCAVQHYHTDNVCEVFSLSITVCGQTISTGGDNCSLPGQVRGKRIGILEPQYRTMMIHARQWPQAIAANLWLYAKDGNDVHVIGTSPRERSSVTTREVLRNPSSGSLPFIPSVAQSTSWTLDRLRRSRCRWEERARVGMLGASHDTRCVSAMVLSLLRLRSR